MTSNTVTTNAQNKDAFQDAFSTLVEHYFEPEEDSGPCYPEITRLLTPQEEEEIIKEWSECSLKQLDMLFDHLSQLINSRNQEFSV